MAFLQKRDNTFMFPEDVHFKNCCHLACDQMEKAMQMDKQPEPCHS
jgi:hypothetical protein